MTAAEFQAAREALALSDDQLAAELGVIPNVVRGWADGTVRIPKRHAEQLAWRAALAKHEAAFAASGLPVCDRFHAMLEATPSDARAMERHHETLEAHLASCPVCTARQRFAEEHLDPLPPPPQPRWVRLFVWIEKVPAWARPAAIGASLLGVLVSLRLLFALPLLFTRPERVGEALLAVAAAMGAGFAGGFAYSLTRPTLRKLGVVGAYLTGVVCVVAYMGALAVAAPVAFGEPIIEDRSGLVIFAIVSIFFGLFIGHSWFRDTDSA